MGHLLYLVADGKVAEEYYLESLKIMKDLIMREPDRAEFQLNLVENCFTFAFMFQNEKSSEWVSIASVLLKRLKQKGVVVDPKLEQLWGLLKDKVR